MCFMLFRIHKILSQNEKKKNFLMEKYGNKSPFMKFVHQNTGYLIAGVFVMIVLAFYIVYDKDSLFFERWTCPMMEQYRVGNATAHDYPKYENMTDDNRLRFDQIYQDDCQ